MEIRWDYSSNGYLDALKHFTDLKEEGKIKMVALTNFNTQRLQIILENGISIDSNQMVDAWGRWSLFQALLETLNQSSKTWSLHTKCRCKVHTRSDLRYQNILLKLDEEDVNIIQEVISKGKDLQRLIGDCGDASKDGC
ncbi:hypothetical protein CTI12_AA108520 [Artemisia annua]|uniref:NADP-dependent oxidoreductase domain-containing protein n=1 Tax=Artemisia annua TaxID=35608 RepID=A0A2U1PHP0_ARTAN|nr:hypothetical protein CTI12_AA108520 [Artemisia annua]